MDYFSHMQLRAGYLLETDVLQPPPGSFVRDAGGGDGIPRGECGADPRLRLSGEFPSRGRATPAPMEVGL